MPSHIHFDDMAWPVPDSELEWRLRYGKPTRNDLLVAASILSAYQALILRKPLKRGAEIVSKMRRILNHSTK